MKHDRKKNALLCKMQASFTVEASVIIPLILFIIIFAIRIAMEQYEEIKEQAQQVTVMEEVDPVKAMWSVNHALEGMKNED